jgi:hypothetical protein
MRGVTRLDSRRAANRSPERDPEQNKLARLDASDCLPSGTASSGQRIWTGGEWQPFTPPHPKAAVFGPVHTDEDKQTLTHSMFVSLFPNWLGQTQPRVVKIEGDMLHLSSATPIDSGRLQHLDIAGLVALIDLADALHRRRVE